MTEPSRRSSKFTKELHVSTSSAPDVDTEPTVDGPGVQGESVPNRRRFGAAIIVFLVGAALTVAVSWVTLTVVNHNERRLLRVQAEQAGEVITAALPNSAVPLQSSLDVARATDGDPAKFVSSIGTSVGTKNEFVNAELWRESNGSVVEVAHVGTPPMGTAAEVRAVVDSALSGRTFIVKGFLASSDRRIAYAYGTSGSPVNFAVYAERAIPPARRTAIGKNSAFSDLNFAIYLGNTTAESALVTTSFAHLPVTGLSDTIRVPYGSSSLTTVVAPSGQLDGALAGQLPWIFAVLGAAITLLLAWGTERLVRRRHVAERDAGEIRSLYGELGQLYGQQRDVAETLQHALLPPRTPDIDGIQFAVRYVAGAHGVDVGGDWYSAIQVDETHFAFVVGDVSGRGVSAATVMASLRYTIRAYAFEGHNPSRILEVCAQHVRTLEDGHFATVLVGVADLSTNEITIANAGHLNPLVIDAGGAHFLETRLGLPLGVRDSRYEEATFPVQPGMTLVGFTDGLVERRGESIDVGLERLRRSAETPDLSVEQLLTKLITDLADEGSEDDIALLAIRWVTATVPASG
jgi:serine phosphatase RsbU (regulator of sigma subunit)